MAKLKFIQELGFQQQIGNKKRVTVIGNGADIRP